MSTVIQDALLIATQAHYFQQDKAGRPYIIHPLRVWHRIAEKHPSDYVLQAIAILHDVFEDGGEEHRHMVYKIQPEHASDRLVNALILLSKKEGESYDDFIDRLINGRNLPHGCDRYRASQDAMRVKLEDLTENLDHTRLPGKRDQKVIDRCQKYIKAHIKITDALRGYK